jgi:hypothetical protein
MGNTTPDTDKTATQSPSETSIELDAANENLGMLDIEQAVIDDVSATARPAATATAAEEPVSAEPTSPVASVGGILKAGSFVELVDHRWFACADVNAELSVSRSRIALLLEDCRAATDGVDPRAARTFTLREFYRDGRPTLDYTMEGVKQLFRDYRRDQPNALEHWNRTENAILAGIERFEQQYTSLESDRSRLAKQ